MNYVSQTRFAQKNVTTIQHIHEVQDDLLTLSKRILAVKYYVKVKLNLNKKYLKYTSDKKTIKKCFLGMLNIYSI